MVEEKSGSEDTFSNPESIEVMTEMYLSAVKSVLDSLNEAADDGTDSDIMYLLAQAQARWLSSALRYWQQIAAILSARSIQVAAEINNGDGGASADARRVRMLDKARAALREISTLSFREAKLLQNDFVKIEAELRECLGAPEDDLEGPRRFGKTIT